MTPNLKLLINNRWNAYRKKNCSLYNHLKLKVRCEIIKAKRKWVEKKSKTPNGMWNVVNDITGRQVRVPLTDLAKQFTSITEMVTEINKTFSDNFQISSELPQINKQSDWNVQVSEFDVLKELCQNKDKKASPKNDIPSRLYKHIAVILAAPLSHIINYSVRQQTVPQVWKIAQVSPLPKSNNVVLSNLRPISLLPIMGKIMERIILHKMKSVIINQIDMNQYAYRPLMSSTCALIDITDYIAKNLDSRDCSCVALIAIDFSKAFDLIDHGILLSKMLKMCNSDNKNTNLPIDFIAWVKSYLSNRKQTVMVQGVSSSQSSVSSGVPQGSILGPLLFNLFVSDLCASCDNVKMVKFADDTTILVPINKNSVDIDLLKVKIEINNLLQWSTANKMTVNKDKSHILYCRRPSPNLCIIPSNISDVSTVSYLKLLGVTFHEHLSFKPHFDAVIKKASQRLYFLRILKKDLSKSELWNVYYTLIRSLLEYAAPIFLSLPQHIVSSLDKLQRRAHRIICGYGIDCTCEIDNLTFRRSATALKLFKKLKTSVTHPLTSHMCNIINVRGSHTLAHINTSHYRDSFFNKCIILTNNIVIN